ncbi:MAG: 2-phospho-L-lactate guanylyltransferase [Solirubrobacterales bacterium]|nr:2-phospho-L-lactate guanylyltransferase [Solirubrobacterales bacterium]
MLTVAVLPIKRFNGAKQRLRKEYSPDERRALAEAMFSDVLAALDGARSLDELLVVSGDPVAQRAAMGYGAVVRAEDDHGHNPAASMGIREALHRGADRALLVPGDCPMLDPNQLDELLTRRPGSSRSALIVPDRHGTGTNALLLAPPDSLAPSFGPGSCERHAADAESAGIAHEVIEVPSLALDVDTPDDLEALHAELARTRDGAAHTREMLGRLMGKTRCWIS